MAVFSCLAVIMHTIADVVEVMEYSAPNTIRLNRDVSRDDLIEFATGVTRLYMHSGPCRIDVPNKFLVCAPER
jgi:hypothetical protein